VTNDAGDGAASARLGAGRIAQLEAELRDAKVLISLLSNNDNNNNILLLLFLFVHSFD